MRVLKPGDKVGEYILEARVGRGTFGEVWRAHHVALNRVVAVKVPTDPEYVKNLRTEGIIQFSIDNPHIVRTLGLDPWHEPPYLVTEFVDGSSLRDLLKDGKPLAVETAVEYARQILDGLSAAHAAGVIHRDLKPENILIDRTNCLKITDFGLGRVQETTASTILRTGSLQAASGESIAGTIEYMAPEQKTPGGTIDARTDLYAFGVILFEMLTATRPSGADHPSDLCPEVPDYLDEIHCRCFCRPNARFASAAAAIDALNAEGRIASPEIIAQPSSPPKGRERVAVRDATPSHRSDDLRQLVLPLGRGVTMKLVRIEPGEFMMGSPPAEEGRFDGEGPQHKVTITRPFYMGVYQVTQEQYEAVVGNNPSHFRGAKNPVEQVSWYRATAFYRKVSEKTGKIVRLPTEAEWEYTCRAGEDTPWNLHGVPLDQKAWYDHNSGRKTHPVGQLRPNRWGLYDMHGNVLEWCADWFGNKYYAESPAADPSGPGDGLARVLRGGGYGNEPRHLRSASRYRYMPDYCFNGFGLRAAVDVR